MRAALEMVGETEDRRFLFEVLNKLLRGEKVPPPGPDLTAEGLRWYQLAIMPEGESDRDLAQKIEAYLTSRLYLQLDPEDALSQLRCPVFLIHGKYDDHYDDYRDNTDYNDPVCLIGVRFF